MAQVGSITAESSSSEFLEQAKTEELAEKFDGGNLAKIADEFTKVIEEHKEKGLSRRALSIEGRSPLNEIANEMIARLQVTVADVEDAKAITEAKGNDHTNKEADKFLKEVLKKYEEKCKKVDEALKSCENASYKDTYKDGDEEKTRTVYCKNGITVNYSISGASTTKITKSGSRDSDSHFDGEYAKFEEAFKAAETYYDGKVKEAIDFYNANGKGALPTGGADGIPLSMPNDEERPEGVHPDAKKEVYPGGRGARTVYTNPDGSTVEIVTENGKIKTHKVRNRYGYVTETYKYDNDGNMTHKNVWSYKKVEGKDHVYESSYTRYEKNSNGEWEATGEPKSYGYSYPVEDENGNVTINNQEGGDVPDDSQVAEPEPFTGRPTGGVVAATSDDSQEDYDQPEVDVDTTATSALTPKERAERRRQYHQYVKTYGGTFSAEDSREINEDLRQNQKDQVKKEIQDSKIDVTNTKQYVKSYGDTFDKEKSKEINEQIGEYKENKRNLHQWQKSYGDSATISDRDEFVNSLNTSDE